ncbi:hypothetical protein TRFO_25922 [Tritrichomonas foetus]|uniref:Uncharacterized protein n=1 Tax=Tritrichomonas foetus TaxID=1144522 RepID=A0A1J4K4L9_9EUKA|nr:hypothetical protein TRFO_25922 [Tritrichomonas foetus]|eukprot:OHT06139.1 hypothetical protein TRFO_25922 [Tritrichomonas foetus]
MSTLITNDFLSDLHQKKQNAIDALDFETAEYYYNEIQNQITQRAQAQIEEIDHETMVELSKIQKNHRDVLEDLAEEKRKSDARLYSKFQVLFQETQDDQIHQLMDLEKERGLTLLEESEREIPEQIELLNTAKKEAMLSHFAKAKELRQQARDVGEEELERRRKEVEEHFEELKIQMLQQHKDEMDQISDLHEEESKQLKEKSDHDLNEAKRKLKEAVDLLKDRATVRCQAVTANELTKKAAIDSLMAKINDSMKEYNLMPTVEPKLTKSEQMRLTTLCPTRAAMNRVESTPEDIVRRAEAATAKGTTCRTGLRPPSHSSTGLISRAYTATIGKR